MNLHTHERRLVAWAISMLLAGVVALWMIYLLRTVVLVLYVSTLLAIGFSPAVHWIEHRRGRVGSWSVPRWAAILIFYIGCLLTLAAMLAVILPPLVAQAQELWAALPWSADMVQAKLVKLKLLPPKWTWKDLYDKLPSSSLAVTGLAVTSLLGALESAVGAIGAAATVLVLPYYLLVEAEAIQLGALRLFTPERRPRVARVTRDVTLKVGAWIGSQILLCVIIGAIASLTLWLLGVPYFYVLGLIAGLGELVPVIGPLLAAVPAVLTGWTVSPNMAFVVVVYFCAQQVFENYVLIPTLMQRRVGVSAVTVIVALLVGTSLLGVIGALLAVPTAAIAQVLLHEYLDREDA